MPCFVSELDSCLVQFSLSTVSVQSRSVTGYQVNKSEAVVMLR